MCIDGRFQWTELQNKEYWDKQRDSQRDKKMCHDFFELCDTALLDVSRFTLIVRFKRHKQKNWKNMAITAKLNFKILKAVYWVCMKPTLQFKGKKMTCNYAVAEKTNKPRELASHLVWTFNEFI